MSLNLESKKAIVAEVSNTLTTAQTIVIAEYHKVSVSSMTTVRANARQANVYLRVLKNTLARKAVAGTQFAPLSDKMSGQLVYSISEDPIAAAKVINDFAKENTAVKIIAGMYNERLLDVDGVKSLASIPAREDLLAMLMGVMQEVPAKFVRCVAAIRDKAENVA